MTDDRDDQITMALDGLTRHALRMRPPGEKPLGAPERFCQARIRIAVPAVTCYGPLDYATDWLGRTITVCTRPGCGERRLVPRIVVHPEAPVCAKGHRIAGENEGRSASGPAWCRRCRAEKNLRVREKHRRQAGRTEAA